MTDLMLIFSRFSVTDCYIVKSPNYKNIGKQCQFPFKYDGKEYNRCATMYPSRERWCATVPNFNRTDDWGVCNPECTRLQGRFIAYKIFTLLFLIKLKFIRYNYI